MMDDTAGLQEVGEEDLESREKPKVTYICGSKPRLITTMKIVARTTSWTRTQSSDVCTADTEYSTRSEKGSSSSMKQDEQDEKERLNVDLN